MTILASLPAQVVQSFAGDIDALRAEAEASQQHFHLILLDGLTTKKARLTAIGTALGFPAHFGMNFDALYDCMTDLRGPRVIVLSGLGDDPESHAIVAIFCDVAQFFAERGEFFRVLYKA